ncbi:MAG TPA: FAD-dependent oxidoreductase [Acidimicrobiia bacterium]|nr:FAD-dependent oxidoreductase [Acidimicrobiia bacterium]
MDSGAGRRDYDVVVIGSGVAGLSAALEASDAGRSVLLVEAEGRLGGSSALSGGIIMAAGTSVQREAGIDDDAEDLYRDYVLFNQFGVVPGLARRLATDAGPAVEWLRAKGVEFHRELMYAAEERRPRSHVPRRGGQGVVRVLADALSGRPAVDVAFGRRVDRLLVHRGRVTGAAVDDDEVRAGAVVVASGGFGANPSLWAEHLPSLAAAGGSAWYVGAAGARGDAFALGAQAGADVVGHDRALLLATPAFARTLEVYFPGWLLMVDRAGARRVDESTSYAVMELAHRRHGPLFAIFDDTAKKSAQPHLAPEYKQHIPGVAPGGMPSNWTDPVIDEMVAAGRVARAGTLEDLARRLSIDAAGLVASVGRYNGAAREGRDVEFGKDGRFLREVVSPPFYGAELRLSILALTAKGLRIDADARVLDRAGTPIRGLFAAGECTGGVLGDVYVGSGNSYANCVVFGRVAGRSAGTLATVSGD